jgi:hypothetical protein
VDFVKRSMVQRSLQRSTSVVALREPMTRKAREPNCVERVYVNWLARRADGNPAIPTLREVRDAARPRSTETKRDASYRVMAAFAETVAQTERRTTAAITASGFALTLSGLLVKEKHVVASGFLVAASLLAFGGMAIGLLGQAIHLGGPIARELTSDDLTTALYSYTRKEARAQAALMLSGVALMVFVAGLVITRHWL